LDLSGLTGVTVLFVPGLRDHVAEHWQTLLAAEIPGSVTVEPLTEGRLSRHARVKALDAALSRINGDVVIAAHSAGALMVVNWALAPTRRIRGALLATPADVENPLPPGYPSYDDLADNGWTPIPRKLLPFRAIVAASRNDPLAQLEKVAGLARAWGAELEDVGDVGHLNPAAGYGRWDGARPLLERLAASGH
jgi:predicted alpha/beta hydrolase family esterase